MWKIMMGDQIFEDHDECGCRGGNEQHETRERQWQICQGNGRARS